MKNQKSILLLLGLALNATPGTAQQTTNDPQQKALEVLRQTIHDREKRRGNVLPAPTNAAAPAPAPARKTPTFAEIEQQYLQGKITARQFQKYLQEYKLEAPPKGTASTNADALALEVLRKQTGKAGTEAATAPAKVDPARQGSTPSRADPRTDRTGTAPDQGSLADVEKKMDELLRLKAAREQAAQTNAVAATGTNSNATAAGPKTKRQQLDELLKLYIDGKISEEDYKDKRSKVIAGPD